MSFISLIIYQKTDIEQNAIILPLLKKYYTDNQTCTKQNIKIQILILADF